MLFTNKWNEIALGLRASNGYNDGGGGTQTSTTVQSADPWGAQQPYLTDIFSQANNLYYNNSPAYYPGQEVAPQSAATQAAQQLALNAAAPSQGLANIGAGVAGNVAAAGDITNNPALNAAAMGAIRPVVQQLQEQVLPQIGSAAIAGGAYGGARQGILESNVVRDATQAMIDRTAQLYSDAYGQGLDAQNNLLLGLPGTVNLQQVPSQLYGAVGGFEDQYQQALINSDINQFNYNQQLPATNLAQYQNFIQGNYGGTGTATSTGPDNSPSTFNQILGTAASVAPLFFLGSDRRLKKDIVSQGKINGFKVYSWTWNDIAEGLDLGVSGKGFGVMAQEVMEQVPEAVSQMDNGYLEVHYDMLGDHNYV